jgi:hypothetical protein
VPLNLLLCRLGGKHAPAAGFEIALAEFSLESGLEFGILLGALAPELGIRE